MALEQLFEIKAHDNLEKVKILAHYNTPPHTHTHSSWLAGNADEWLTVNPVSSLKGLWDFSGLWSAIKKGPGVWRSNHLPFLPSTHLFIC